MIKNKKFALSEVIAEHEDHVTYLASWGGRQYFIRTFSSGYKEALAAYRALKHAGINMAKMNFHDDDAQIIVYDYFPEEDCLTALSHGPLPEHYFDALFALYRFARFSKIALDWEPQNFMLRGKQMFYLPTKHEPLTDENAFEKKGLRTWFLGAEGLALLERKGYDTSSLPKLSDAEVNKLMVLMAVRYW
ncbi:MAG: hypothetical protein SPG64_05015 [Candidatus Enteromonas sp.]|nr:hypothetical protein [Candidatus Enteromonas sp.]